MNWMGLPTILLIIRNILPVIHHMGISVMTLRSLFSSIKAVLSMLKQIDFRPDLIHCHDWETGLIPVYLKNEFQADSFYWGMKSIITIHNLKFQGVWDVKTMKGLTGFSADLFAPDKLEFQK